MMQQTPEQVLKAAKSILLVDWPDQIVPRRLVKAGLTVYGYSPDGYSRACIMENKAGKTENTSTFPPRKGEEGYLVFETSHRPGTVDIVCIYRPEAEHELILKNNVLPFGAKIVWLQPPVTSSAIAELSMEHGIMIVEGINVAEIAAKI